MGTNTTKILLTEENLQGDLTINKLDLEEYIAHLHIFSALMKPLEYTATKLENTEAEGWAKRGIVRLSTAVSPLLRKILWINR